MHEITETREEAYRKIVQHFSQPGARLGKSVDGIGCAYRQEVQGEVVKCAVGCLIPDEAYDADTMDKGSYTWDNLDDDHYGYSEGDTDIKNLDHAGVLTVRDHDTLHYLIDMQQAHDASDTVEEFLKKAERIDRGQGD